MREVEGLTIRMFGREYGLGVARWGVSGAPALMLVNRATGAVLPVGLEGRVEKGQALVPDLDGILAKLVELGVVKAIGAAERGDPFKTRLCEIVHPGVLGILGEMEREREASLTNDRGGQGR